MISIRIGLILAVLLVQGCSDPVTQTGPGNHQSDDAKEMLPLDHWHAFFSPDIPYYNITQAPVTARAAPGLASPPVGTIAPGAGGYIAACDEAGAWCELPLNGQGDTGWVLMRDFAGSAL